MYPYINSKIIKYRLKIVFSNVSNKSYRYRNSKISKYHLNEIYTAVKFYSFEF